MGNINQNKKPEDWSTPLAGYKRNKKILTPPLATLPRTVLTSWTNDRMPDMLWAVLIRKHHPGDIGYATFRNILDWLVENKGETVINGVTHTDISNFNQSLKKAFIKHIVEQAGTDSLKPLLLLPALPAYDEWREALAGVEITPNDDYNQLASSIVDVMFHQTQEATDVRWVKLMGTILSDRLRLPATLLDEYLEYPNKYDQRSVRSSIRASEMSTELVSVNGGLTSNEWPKDFWRHLQEETVCIPEISGKKEDVMERYKAESEDKDHFNEILPEIRESLVKHFLATSTTTGIDAKHETVFGLAMYALDVFIETVILKVGGVSSGRVSARIIFEAYVNLKHLVAKERVGELLWDTYREYGVGQISLIDRKYKEGRFSSSMVDTKVIDKIANEDKWQEYTPINLGNWDSSDLRTISSAIGEKKLYDKYYPYTSGFIHANWGAVREASFQLCLNPLHRMHRIPQFGLPTLPSVNEDCRQMINSILEVVDEQYPDFIYQIDKRLIKKPNSYKAKHKNNRTA